MDLYRHWFLLVTEVCLLKPAGLAAAYFPEA